MAKVEQQQKIASAIIIEFRYTSPPYFYHRQLIATLWLTQLNTYLSAGKTANILQLK